MRPNWMALEAADRRVGAPDLASLTSFASAASRSRRSAYSVCGPRGGVPVAVAANAVVRGERGAQVGVELRDASRLEAAQASPRGWRGRPRGAAGRLGVRLTVGGHVVVGGEHLG